METVGHYHSAERTFSLKVRLLGSKISISLWEFAKDKTRGIKVFLRRLILEFAENRRSRLTWHIRLGTIINTLGGIQVIINYFVQIAQIGNIPSFF